VVAEHEQKVSPSRSEERHERRCVRLAEDSRRRIGLYGSGYPSERGNQRNEEGKTMNKAALVVLGALVGAGSVSADWMDAGTKSVRAEYVWDDEAGTEDANGFEIGFGAACYDLDDIALVLTHVKNGDMERQFLGVSVQENFPIKPLPIPLIPFAGAAAGFAWVDIDNSGVPGGPDRDESSFTARLELGALYLFCDWFALSGSARLSYSNEDVYLDDSNLDLEDTNWDLRSAPAFITDR